MSKPLLVGEQNPYGGDPYFALYPEPEGCSGWRLCHRIFGMDERDYLRTFDRVNLCSGPWLLSAAKQHALQIHANREGPLILLGAKVCQAFGTPYEPFAVQRALPGYKNTWFIFPHPSGRCRTWNDPANITRARELLKEVLA